MFRIAAACIGALLLCTACLTKEELGCWYEDMCLSSTSGPPATHQGVDAPVSGR